jgi:hypothetical protein
MLVMIFLTGNHTAVLERYPTWLACQTERDRIGYEMAEAYPQESEVFRITCQRRRR